MSLHWPVGDGAGTPLDQGVSTLLFLATLLLGFVAYRRLRNKGFKTLPTAGAWAAAALAGASLVLALVLPPILRPDVVSARPSTSAVLRILSPAQGQRFQGNPATVPVRLHLTGGRIVPTTSTRLVPNAGHVHVFLDGALVSMAFTLSSELKVPPGTHRLDAEFVAVDHGPFDPRVRASVVFSVSP